MGSSAMGASVLRKKIQAAGHPEVTVVNKSIASLADDYDVVVTHQDLTARAKQRTPSAVHFSVDNFMGSPRYDEIVELIDQSYAGGGAAAPAEEPAALEGDVLARESIVLGGTATNRDDAITEAGDLLVAAGAVDPAYVDAMHEREKSVSTAMGNSLAIPHGTNEAKGLIQPHRDLVRALRRAAGLERQAGRVRDRHRGRRRRPPGPAVPDRGDVHRPGRRGPASRRHDARRRARDPRRRPGLTPGGQTGWTVTGTPFNAAFPLTSSRSGSVRSLIETPATVEALRIRVPADLVAVAVRERHDAGHHVVDRAHLDVDGADP